MTPHIISYLEFIGIGFDQYVVNDGGKNTKEEPTNVEEPAKEKVKNTSKKMYCIKTMMKAVFKAP
jgi:hypothetical protein